MKQLIEFIPIFIFFALYKLYDIYVATGALIVATLIQLIIVYLLYKKVEKMQLITFIVVAVFGGLTLFFHNDEFIKLKVTIVYTCFALALTISHIIGKSAIKSILGKELLLPDSVWAKIHWAWVCFFLVCAGINMYVAYNLPLNVWVNFKVFGLFIMTLVYALLTGGYIYSYLQKHKMPAQENTQGTKLPEQKETTSSKRKD